MADLQDLGGGFKQFTGAATKPSSALEQAQQILSLRDLQNRVAQAPLEIAAKEAELKLKANEVTQIDTNNLLKQQQLFAAVAGEQREKAKFTNEQLLNIRQGFQQSFEMGSAMLAQAVPGAMSQKKENGAVAISIPGMTPFAINPGNLTDPKEIASQVQDRVQRWEKTKERYTDIYANAQAVKTQLALGTGAGDIAAIYAKAKMQDPGGRVTDGDYQSVINSPNVTQQVKNLLQRAMTQEGPIFGGPNSPTRRAFLQSATTALNTEKEMFLPRAEFFLKGQILADNLPAEKIFSPAGDITLETFAPKGRAAEGPMNASTPQPPKAKPVEASVAPSTAEPQALPEAPRVKATKASFNQLMQNIFVVPGKK